MILQPMLKKGIEDMLSLLKNQGESSATDFNDCIYEEDSEQICNDVYEYQQVQVSDEVVDHCEWSYEEDTSRICNHVYEYQQVQGLCTDPTADSSDDDFQEAPLPDSVLAQLTFG